MNGIGDWQFDDVSSHCALRMLVPKPLTGRMFSCCFKELLSQGHVWTLYFWRISPQVLGLAQWVHILRRYKALTGYSSKNTKRKMSASVGFLALLVSFSEINPMVTEALSQRNKIQHYVWCAKTIIIISRQKLTVDRKLLNSFVIYIYTVG